MQQRKDEILAKKAKLAEIKRQRELRQKEFSDSRQSLGESAELASARRSRPENKEDLETLISSLVGDGRSKSIDPTTPASSSRRDSRHPSLPRSDVERSDATPASPASPPTSGPVSTQALSFAPLTTVYEIKSEPTKREVLTYSKGVQTGGWDRESSESYSDSEREDGVRPAPRRLSRRQRERDEELRQNIRREIEEELKAAREPISEEAVVDGTTKQNFPLRALDDEEVQAVTSSSEFLDFIDRSTKVIERALDEEYDVLADYRLGSSHGVDDEDDEYGSKGRKGRRIRETMQFYDERWCRKRIISDIHFSHKYPELLLASYTKNPSAPHDPDGLINVWNLHMQSRPEYAFHASSDILTAKFSPYHPNLILGGCYSGQILLWDTRAKSSAPVQKSALTGTRRSGHTHPVYSLQIVGTQNAHNIITASTDGAVCSWSIDMLAQPQEHLMLSAPHPSRAADELAPTCTAFPAGDPTVFLAGSEQGTIHLCHRYGRAGAPAGADPRIAYAAHTAPVTALSFHAAPPGPADLSDLVLSAALDWSIKLWRVRPPTSTASAPAPAAPKPLLDLPRDDLVYDVRWSPVRPAVFGAVDGAGALEVWDLARSAEVPAARAVPTPRADVGVAAGPRSLNRLAWEPGEGRRVAVGGLAGVVTVFEVGGALGGAEGARGDEWSAVKRLVGRLEGGR